MAMLKHQEIFWRWSEASHKNKGHNIGLEIANITKKEIEINNPDVIIFLAGDVLSDRGWAIHKQIVITKSKLIKFLRSRFIRVVNWKGSGVIILGAVYSAAYFSKAEAHLEQLTFTLVHEQGHLFGLNHARDNSVMRAYDVDTAKFNKTSKKEPSKDSRQKKDVPRQLSK